jgi:general stress protein YciG
VIPGTTLRGIIISQIGFTVNDTVVSIKPVTNRFIYSFFIIYLENAHIDSSQLAISDCVMAAKSSKGDISVREAGRRGGNMTKKRHGPEFYEKIGQKGGQKVKELIERGKSAGK